MQILFDKKYPEPFYLTDHVLTVQDRPQLQLVCVGSWRLTDHLCAHCRVNLSELTILMNQSVPYARIELLGQLKLLGVVSSWQ